MPVVDFVPLVNGLAEHWGPHEENTALLLEAERYKLDLLWADRTTDPNSREVIRARREAERNNITPPKSPMIPPVAHRPTAMAELRLQEYLDRIAEFQTGEQGKTLVSTDEFDASLGAG